MEGDPLLQHKELGANLQGLVGACHKKGGGGMFSPAGGGDFSTRGKRERLSLIGMVRWASASIGRCLRMGGERTSAKMYGVSDTSALHPDASDAKFASSASWASSERVWLLVASCAQLPHTKSS